MNVLANLPPHLRPAIAAAIGAWLGHALTSGSRLGAAAGAAAGVYVVANVLPRLTEHPVQQLVREGVAVPVRSVVEGDDMDNVIDLGATFVPDGATS